MDISRCVLSPRLVIIVIKKIRKTRYREYGSPLAEIFNKNAGNRLVEILDEPRLGHYGKAETRNSVTHQVSRR